jgi:heme/copper-type cytochrome/quinol oxidase subunit 2
MSTRIVLLILSVIACTALMLVPVDSLLAAPEGVHEITINASQFAFDPPVLRVNRGDRVVLTVRATDVVHGLHLDGYDLDVRVEPGTSRRVEFVADRAGKFRYRCSVSCGNLHPFMIGELIVAPNDLFWRAIGLMLIASGTTLVWLRLRPAPEVKRA